MIYLASPYSAEQPELMEARYESVLRYANNLLQIGVIAFSPIVYGRVFHLREWMPGSYDAWKTFNDEMILRSDAVYVLQLEGWQKSRGVQHEIIFAKMNNVPVRMIPWNEVKDENL